MNSTYRKAIRLKTKLRSEFFKMKTPTNWELYRKQRNLYTSMRRQAVKKYFLERCERGAKNTDFWHTIKPFLTNKGYHDDGNDILLHDESKPVFCPGLKKGTVLLEGKGHFRARNYILRALLRAELHFEGTFVRGIAF